MVDLMSVLDSPGSERADLARKITDAICMLLDCHVIPPTEKQLKYAVAIARELSLPLPPEVLQYREAMAVFLSAHAETYRQKKGKK